MLGWLPDQPQNTPGINPGQAGFGLYAPGVVDLASHLGKGYETFRLGGWQIGSLEQFSNGQWWQLEAYVGNSDPATDQSSASWKMVYNQMTPKQDVVSNLGKGDDYIVIATNNGSSHLIVDIAAPFNSSAQNLTYYGAKPGGNGTLTFAETRDAYEAAVAPPPPSFLSKTDFTSGAGNDADSDDSFGSKPHHRAITLTHEIDYTSPTRPALERVEVTLRYTDAKGIVQSETHVITADDPSVKKTEKGYLIDGAVIYLIHPPMLNKGTEPEVEILSVISYFAGGVEYVSPGPFAGVDVVCFAAGTMVLTARGLRAVQTLAPGDLVVTRDRGLQPLRWIGLQSIKAADLAQNPKLLPIRLRAGALGAGLPRRDLLLSSQHRVMLNSPIVERMTKHPAALAAAKDLLGADGIEIAAQTTAVTYVHLLFDHHEVIYAEGAACETLLLGKMAIQMLTPKQRGEILVLHPNLEDDDFSDRPALPILRGAKARHMINRHVKNNHCLQQEEPEYHAARAG